MAIDKNNLPPALRELLADLEKMGIKPTIVDGDELAKIAAAQGRKTSEASSEDSTEKPCDCPACTLRKTFEARLAREDRPESIDPASAAAGLPSRILAVLDRQGAKVAMALTDQVKNMVDPLRVELEKQKEIGDSNMARIAQLSSTIQHLDGHVSELQMRLADLNARHIDLTGRHNDLEAQLADLEERHRKQVGLLHKRVTKRKGEVAVVRGRVAGTKGRVTKAEKRLSNVEKFGGL